MQNQVNRYSQVELDEFRLLIEKKLKAAEEQLLKMETQISDINENEEAFGADTSDDSNTIEQLELLNTLANRQEQHIRDLKNALLRIKNKSYGICAVTGQLIDKKRLLAVLTTTKSLVGKTMEAATQEKKEKIIFKKNPMPKTFTRIIKKTNPTITPKVIDIKDELEEEEEYDNEDYFDEFDNYIAPYSSTIENEED